jgi:hypothetical protein
MTNTQRLASEVTLLVVVGGGVLWAQAPGGKPTDPIADVVRAREFQMVDKDGTVLAAMRVNPAFGGPVVQAREFHVVDDKGVVRAAMRLDGSTGGPDVTFWSRDAKRTVAQLSVNKQDRVSLVFSSPAGKHQITIAATDRGPVVNLADAEGRQGQLQLMAPQEGQAKIVLNGRELVPTDAAKK